MIIRSQDKKGIVNLNNIDTICIVEGQIQYFNGEEDSKGVLGKYSTEEKAIKVLDMIQEAYLSTTEFMLDGIIKASTTLPRAIVFQIPQDSEV